MAAGDRTSGRRVYPRGGQLRLAPGDYGCEDNGSWWVRPPRGSMGWLMEHTIAEHSDGTITVEPSILLDGVWHGYLRDGVWEEV